MLSLSSNDILNGDIISQVEINKKDQKWLD